MATAPAFGNFDQDLLGSLIPFVEAKYSVVTDRESRAWPVFRWAAGSR
jgi:enterochelin esterase-like enzyme